MNFKTLLIDRKFAIRKFVYCLCSCLIELTHKKKGIILGMFLNIPCFEFQSLLIDSPYT